ncbi:TPA: hypothetical protein ACTUT5_001918 [Legionella anisa]|uniref:Uncharacterized protein n=1 Tax=Legionella anisa TaxID=28082 RepID=A0AAX0WYZ3_9GAMM|nr:hypothetical protein [Legionella anisa]AWN75732.1 hypothetical protein DLD14_06370 [Legionella anisa]MBN5935360.1 hypothetical protein [Legionella anisa]MCW8426371.1 hypothetical protein [Legionella anisa]MCW8448031.1 hypothetical protein [Legionella anisa]PNL63568.1 hypothetical protein A6J39_016025 [Legionella anisa]
MYCKYPGFFPSKNIETFSGVQFSNVVKTSSAIQTLYRGDNHLSDVVFLLPTLLIGVFCQSLPEVVDMEQIRLHKLTNLSNDFHMVSMSEDLQIALDWGSGCFIEIDPSLFSNYVVDVHATFRKNQLNFPARMEREKEHTALIVPFCSIKKITIHYKELVNPFYVCISPDNHEATIAFNAFYCQLISLLRKKYTQEVAYEEEKTALYACVTAYLEFYDKFSGSGNPFNKSFSELLTLYPEFMENFFQSNHVTSKIGLMKDFFLSSSGNSFKEHPYTKIIDASYIHRAKESTTCDEDDWAKPGYD